MECTFKTIMRCLVRMTNFFFNIKTANPANEFVEKKVS